MTCLYTVGKALGTSCSLSDSFLDEFAIMLGAQLYFSLKLTAVPNPSLYKL